MLLSGEGCGLWRWTLDSSQWTLTSAKWFGGFVYSNCPLLGGSRGIVEMWNVDRGQSSDNGNDAQMRLDSPITVNIPLMRCFLGK